MQFLNTSASIFIPDGISLENALKRTTHIAVGAHQDDLEIMATAGVLECFQSDHKWFGAVVVTDGSGSPRSGDYAKYNAEQMKTVRKKEQEKAAIIGEYSFLITLDYTSSEVKSSPRKNLCKDLSKIFNDTTPQKIYTHNLFDKHDTHVAVSLAVIEALRTVQYKGSYTVLGCEVWRNLDWLPDSKKVVLNCTDKENLAAALLGVFDSQISGGKRYDLAALGRRRSNATFFESHGVDSASAVNFAVDLTELVKNRSLNPSDFAQSLLDTFKTEVVEKVSSLSKGVF